MIRIAAALVLLATPSIAADCPQNRAIYVEKDNGYELRFRPTLRWEASANTMAVVDLIFPDGKTSVWGTIWLPNGTSHDKIDFLTHDCALPAFDPAKDVDPTHGSTQEELEACKVWEGIIYALADNDIAELPWFEDGAAAQTVLLPDLGPTIRYSGLVLSPGDEPHDVFTFKGCAD